MKIIEMQTREEARALAKRLKRAFSGWVFTHRQKQIDGVTLREYTSFKRSRVRGRMDEIESKEDADRSPEDEAEYEQLKKLEQRYRAAGRLKTVEPRPIPFWCVRARNRKTGQCFYLYTWDAHPIWLQRYERPRYWRRKIARATVTKRFKELEERWDKDGK